MLVGELLKFRLKYCKNYLTDWPESLYMSIMVSRDESLSYNGDPLTVPVVSPAGQSFHFL